MRVALAAAMAVSLVAGDAAAQESPRARLTMILNSVFGAGAWRVTGGYRTPEREDELREQGAMTVRPGGLSRHSLGSPDAPGAYDIVVDGMSPFEAANRLRQAGAPFARYMPKRAHGTQGPHLHLEPYAFDLRATGPQAPVFVQANYVRPSRPRIADEESGLIVIEEGVRRRRTPEAGVASAEPAPPPVAERAPDALAELRKAAMRDSPQAQLALGQAYIKGEITTRDVRAAVKWIELAASNPKADDPTRQAASAALESMADGLEDDYARRKLRLARRDP